MQTCLRSLFWRYDAKFLWRIYVNYSWKGAKIGAFLKHQNIYKRTLISSNSKHPSIIKIFVDYSLWELLGYTVSKSDLNIASSRRSFVNILNLNIIIRLRHFVKMAKINIKVSLWLKLRNYNAILSMNCSQWIHIIWLTYMSFYLLHVLFNKSTYQPTPY